MTDTKVYVKVAKKKKKKKNTYTKIIHHFKNYHVILLKHGKLFHSDMHIIKSECILDNELPVM